MKYVVISLPGMADVPCDELGGKTPFEVAKLPNLHQMTRQGRLGQVKLGSEHWGVFPDVALLNLLGYDAEKTYTGRAPLEAADMELKLEDNEVPFRVNFVTEYEGVLTDPTAGNITDKEARALLNFLNKKLASGFVRFFPGAGYRHIAVIKDSHGFEALSARTVSPHDIKGSRVSEGEPKGPGAELLKKLMGDAKLLLQDHEVNQVRLDLGENPANLIWFWGQGKKPEIEKFRDRFALTGAMISRSAYARGIGRLAGLSVLELGHYPHDEQGEMYEKVSRLMLDALQEKEFVCMHLPDSDEASWNRDMRQKISVMESVDYFLLSKVRGYMEKNSDVRVLVTPCYAMPWSTGRRISAHVPFLLTGSGVEADDCEKFSEAAARTSETRLRSGELMEALKGQKGSL